MTKGIIEAEASFTPSSGFVVTRDGKLYFRNEWFEKYEDAVVEFERQRANKIDELRMKIGKLLDKRPVLRKEKFTRIVYGGKAKKA